MHASNVIILLIRNFLVCLYVAFLYLPLITVLCDVYTTQADPDSRAL